MVLSFNSRHNWTVDYSLLRTLMWEAGMTFGVPPLRLLLQRTRHHLDNFILEFLASTDKKRDRIYRTLLLIIVYKPVPDRPDRAELRGGKTLSQSLPIDETT